MDTLKTVVKSDTLILKNVSKTDKVQHRISVETTTYKDSSNGWDKLCDCKILPSLIWPITILLIIIAFRNNFKNVIDIIGDRIKNGAGVKFGPFEIGQELSKQEQETKAEKEFNEVINNNEEPVYNNIKTEGETTEKIITKDEFIPKYIHIERRLFEVLLKNLYPKYRILSNRRIQGYEYDLIIDSQKEREYDFIIEVKYFPNRFSKNNLTNIGLKLDFMVQLYKNTFNRKVKPILFVIINNDTKIEGNINDVFDYVNVPFRDKKYIKIVILNQVDIENLNSIRIYDILDY